MNRLSHNQLRDIIKKLDPKSKARLRATSKEFRDIITEMEPPTGSYDDKTGRFQKIFDFMSSEHDPCYGITSRAVNREMANQGYYYVLQHEQGDEAYLQIEEIIESYKKNTLLHDWRERTKKLDPAKETRNLIRRSTNYTMNNDYDMIMRVMRNREARKGRYRRGTKRLLRAFSKDISLYKETAKLLNRRSKPYTKREETHHKDRLMDVIIIRTLVFVDSDDPTKVRYTQNGRKMTLNEKINRLVKRCTNGAN